ncbi:hypothetical protein EUGRSUZ_L02294 [Eucalyptus grandis]|uniref:Uncharacterized protein n=1 Tax=Eucalyptus grandis TaxID=71139 RepID=A0A058ZR64_EUCGR|nr:hypothetical protein EUGRSUZ_L02294 [Eucalyptus grandis]
MSILRNSNKKSSYLASAGTADQISPIEDDVKPHGLNGKKRIDPIVLQLQPQAVRDPEIRQSVAVLLSHLTIPVAQPRLFLLLLPLQVLRVDQLGDGLARLPRRPRTTPAPSSSSPSSHPLDAPGASAAWIRSLCCRSSFPPCASCPTSETRMVSSLLLFSFCHSVLHLRVGNSRRRRRRQRRLGTQLRSAGLSGRCASSRPAMLLGRRRRRRSMRPSGPDHRPRGHRVQRPHGGSESEFVGGNRGPEVAERSTRAQTLCSISVGTVKGGGGRDPTATGEALGGGDVPDADDRRGF